MRERWLIGLLAVGIVTRLFFLASPPEVVFDEVHFGKFISAYCCTHERFFDIHPPHAKLLIAGLVSLTSYGGQFSFEKIGQPYELVPVIFFRLVPALTGLALPLVVFLLLRAVRVSAPGSFFGGLLVALDNALVVQSRVISLDGVLLLSLFLALLFALWWRRARGIRQVWLALLAGGCAGLAAGSKFTGLVALGLVGLIILLGLWQQRRSWRVARLYVGSGLLVLAGFAVVYLGGWWLHFVLLTEPGPGDAWRVPSGSFFEELLVWHKLMLTANYGLEAGHPDASPWWSWPLLLRPVFYWQGRGAVIYLFGNPIVWWGSTLLLVAAFLFTIRTWLSRRRISSKGGWTFVVGYLASLAPLALVPRALFLYHYFTALIFAVLIGAVWLDRRKAWRHPGILIVCMLIVLLGWLVVSPVSYGWLTPRWWQQTLAQLPRF